MNAVLLICRLLASAVFAVSGVAKLLDRKGTRKALADFGAPASLLRAGTLLLPVVELLTSVALLFNATAWWGAWSAVTLLSLFTVAIATSLLRGRAPDCHCFGQIAAQPVSPKTVVRNILLALPAVVVILAGRNDPGMNPFDWVSGASRLETTLAALSAVLSLGMALSLFAIVRLFALQRELAGSVLVMERLFDAKDTSTHSHTAHQAAANAPSGGLPVGGVAPEFTLPSSAGQELSLTRLLSRGRPIVAFFGSPTCGPCKEILPEVAAWRERFAGRLEVVALLKGTADENALVVKKYPGLEFAFIGDNGTDEAYRSPWTPGAVVISPEGRIGSETAFGVDAIRGLIDRIATDEPSSVTGRVALPEFVAIAPDGQEIGSRELLDGAPLAMLFWNPNCPYCVAMIQDLERWAGAPPPRAPRLVLVQSGFKELPPQRFGAPVVMDADGSVARQLGSVGTPSAVLVDRHGTVVTSVIAGGPDVAALLGIGAAGVPGMAG